MTMQNREELRTAVHRLVEEADEALLMYMLTGPLALDHAGRENGTGYNYSKEQLEQLREASEAYNHGKLKTFSEEEFWERMKQKTGYQREA